jgi:signal transduction histidine kinase
VEPGAVLVLEDDPGVARLERLHLERLGYRVAVAMTVEAARSRIRQGGIDLMVLDYRLASEVSGLDFYRQVQAEGWNLPTILVTGFSDERVLTEAIRAGVRDFVPKTPAYLEDLPPAVERVMKQVRAERQVAESEALRESNQQLQRLSEQLVEADRRKDKFLAMLGHELRNPLAPLANCLHVLRHWRGDAATVERAREVMERQVRYLTRLVDDLLDVSRITRGKILLHSEPLDLAALVQYTVEDRRPALAAAALILLVELPDEPVWVSGDPTRLVQVLDNLLANAGKFTRPGGQVSVRLRPDPSGDRATLTVRDTGIGIEPAILPQVFDSFAQADRSLDRSQGGLGLGLSIVKGLVELHGGEVWARSEGLGRGSEFGFCLPLLARDEATVAREEEEPVRSFPALVPTGRENPAPLRILIVEDNRDAAGSLKELLELFGHEAHVAHSGQAGVEAAHRLQPDVVLCDLGLPGMDGYQVAAALRANPVTAHACLIAVTGYGQEEDQKRSREAGFDRHLVKPVDLEELLGELLPAQGGPSSR